MKKLLISMIIAGLFITACGSEPAVKSLEAQFLDGCSPERVEGYTKEVFPIITTVYKHFDAYTWYRLDTASGKSDDAKEAVVNNAYNNYIKIKPLIPPVCLVEIHQDLLAILEDEYLILDEMLLSDIDRAFRIAGAENWETEINDKLGEANISKSKIYDDLLTVMDEVIQADLIVNATPTPQATE